MEYKEYSFEGLCSTIEKFATCMDDYPYVLDLNKDEYYISEKALDRFLIPANHFTNAVNMHAVFVHPDDLEGLSEDLMEMRRGRKDRHDIRYRWLGKNGEPIWINCRGQVLCDREGKPQFMVGCVNEIGRKPIADNVSGLLDSQVLSEVLVDEFRSNNIGYVMRIGIDDFKDVNDRYGIEYGDYVLKGVAECITSSLLPGQQVYRVPSDEFIIVDYMYNDSEAEALYRRVRCAIDCFIEENHYKAVYTVSAGIIKSSDCGDCDYNFIMKISEYALREAKKRGKNQCYIFDKDDYEAFVKKSKLLVELRKSIANGCKGFDLFFQPLINAKTGKLYSCEALVRFFRDNGQMVSPVEFIPILEETGLIIPVGKWVLEQAVDMCINVQKVIPKFKVGINLSYIQILKSPITDEIIGAVTASGLRPESMVIEITESGYLENTITVKNAWATLQNFGVSIAIDDFGTGYSNLQSIGNLRPNCVKIDRGFTVKAINNEYEYRVLKEIIDMVHSINLQICVEGIETKDELDKIMRLNPDFIQGYYYGKPCKREEFFEKFVNTVEL